MTHKAIVIHPDDRVEVQEFEFDTSYEFRRDTVGGWIEAVSLAEGITAWVNEEGKLQTPPLAPNDLATMIAKLNGGIELPGDYIAGPMVICSYDDDGAAVGLSDELIELLLSISNEQPVSQG